jgi:hypothetical protein
MKWKIRASEDLKVGEFVEFGASDIGRLICRRATNGKHVAARAAAATS